MLMSLVKIGLKTWKTFEMHFQMRIVLFYKFCTYIIYLYFLSFFGNLRLLFLSCFFVKFKDKEARFSNDLKNKARKKIEIVIFCSAVQWIIFVFLLLFREEMEDIILWFEPNLLFSTKTLRQQKISCLNKVMLTRQLKCTKSCTSGTKPLQLQKQRCVCIFSLHIRLLVAKFQFKNFFAMARSNASFSGTWNPLLR